MPRTPSRITQADVARVLRAIEQTGVSMEVVIEADGRIRIVPQASAEKVDSPEYTEPQPKSWN